MENMSPLKLGGIYSNDIYIFESGVCKMGEGEIECLRERFGRI